VVCGTKHVKDWTRPLAAKGRGLKMQMQVGYDLICDCPQPTPTMLMLNSHYSPAGDIVVPDRLITEPAIAVGLLP